MITVIILCISKSTTDAQLRQSKTMKTLPTESSTYDLMKME